MLSGCASAPPGKDGLTRLEQAELLRRERQLQASPGTVRDARLDAYLRRLLARLGPEAQSLRIHVVDRPGPQADLLGGQVLVLRTGLLAQVRDEDELAFVLAHELAHRRLAHVAARRRTEWDAPAAELAADRLAAQTLQGLGYRASAGSGLLRRLLLSTHDQQASALIRSRLAALPPAAAGTASFDPEFEAAMAPYRTTASDRRSD